MAQVTVHIELLGKPSLEVQAKLQKHVTEARWPKALKKTLEPIAWANLGSSIYEGISSHEILEFLPALRGFLQMEVWGQSVVRMSGRPMQVAA